MGQATWEVWIKGKEGRKVKKKGRRGGGWDLDQWKCMIAK